MAVYTKSTVSVIIPTRNESTNIVKLAEAIDLLRSASHENETNFEFLIIDNLSTDQTWKMLLEKFSNDSDVRLIQHLTNLGMQGSIMTGLKECRGGAAIVLQSDLQDPPQIITKMVKEWVSGSKYITTKITKRNSSFVDRQSRTLGYIFLNLLSGVKIQLNSGDFWLIDRSIIDQLVIRSNSRTFFRTIIPRISVPDFVIPYERSSRKNGSTNFNFLGKYEFFIDAMLSDTRYLSMVLFFLSCGIFLISFLMLLIGIPILTSTPEGEVHHFMSLLVVLGTSGVIFSTLLFPITLIIEFLQRIYTDTNSGMNKNTYIEYKKPKL
jgi:dolichol-phosphate mannosyltransferase